MSIDELFNQDAIDNYKDLQARVKHLETLVTLGANSVMRDFFFEVAAGNVTGYSKVSKFGRTTALGTTLTPICSSGFYRTPTAAASLEIVSTDNVNDVAGGAGARQVTIQGLDGNWSAVSQTANLNGTTPVALSTDLTRIYRAFVSESGAYGSQGTPSHNSTITIQETGGGNVWASIPLMVTGFGASQTSIGAYTIEAGKTGLVYLRSVFVDSTRTTNLFFLRRDGVDTVAAPFTAVRSVYELLDVTDNFSWGGAGIPLGPFVGPSDIGFMGQLTTGSGGDVSVNFDIILYDT